MSDFSDRPFVAGSLFGLRAFSVDRLGRLRGPSFDQIFTPGENVAMCRKGESTATFFPTFYPTTFKLTVGSASTTATVDPPAQAPDVEVDDVKLATKEHALASLDCTCGFYAYTDGRNDYKDWSRISAIIEGYGICTTGNRGFRAEKARLVALITPRSKGFPADRLARVLHNYPDVPAYGRKREAIEAHPLTPAEIPTPESCDDFWTRSAS